MMPQEQNPPMPFNGENIPAALKANARWAPWRAQWNEKRKKFDKIPASARPPFYGLSTAKPERWFDYETALKAYQDNPERFAGVGYVMTGPHDVVGIDLDNCVHDNTIEPWAQDVINEMGSYTELSPSGRGLRILAHGSTSADWTNHERGIEVYAGHEPRFLTVTGQRLRKSAQGLGDPGGTRLEALSLRYAKAKTSATIISLEMPDLLDELVLPDLDSLPLPATVLEFLTTGANGGDRSRALFGASVALYNAGLADDEVFSLLANNPYAFEVALDHRRQDHDRAMMYLWVEHCQKGKAKSSPVASLADFENLALPTPRTELQGDASDFDVIETLPTPKAERTAVSKALRFGAQPAGQFAHGATPTWLVKGVIPKAELIVLYGESGAGKSFVALDLAAAIAQGLEWRGRKVKQGRVVYVAAEGATGFRKRLKAYARARGIAVADLDECLFVVDAAPNLMIKDDALDLCKAIQACGKVVMVVIDTLAQTMPGANENAGEDVGKALQHCKGIHRATGAAVLLVHHAGKDASKGARGWSGLRAACDAELEVSKTDEGRKIKSTKEKDDQDGLEWGFSLARVVLDLDEDGDEITSCAVVEAAVPPPSKKSGAGSNKNTGKWAARVLQALGELTQAQTTGIERKAVLDLVVARSPEEGDTTGRIRRQRASHALKQLLEDDEGSYLAEDDGTISLIV